MLMPWYIPTELRRYTSAHKTVGCDQVASSEQSIIVVGAIFRFHFFLSSFVLMKCSKSLQIELLVIMASDETTENPMTQQPYAPAYLPFSGAYPPPGTYPPPYYTYALPPDGTHGEIGGQPVHHPYMMAYTPPPGMVHAHPPPGQGV